MNNPLISIICDFHHNLMCHGQSMCPIDQIILQWYYYNAVSDKVICYISTILATAEKMI
jgi:hypothetical protein